MVATGRAQTGQSYLSRCRSMKTKMVCKITLAFPRCYLEREKEKKRAVAKCALSTLRAKHLDPSLSVHILHSVTLKMTKLFFVRQLHQPPSVIQLMVENQIQMSGAHMAGQSIKLIASLKSSSTCQLPCYPD